MGVSSLNSVNPDKIMRKSIERTEKIYRNIEFFLTTSAAVSQPIGVVSGGGVGWLEPVKYPPSL